MAHDDWRHGLRPAHVVAVEKLQQLVDLTFGEAPDVTCVIDVPRGRADEDQWKKAREP